MPMNMLNDELFACAMQRHDSNDEGWHG